MPGPRRSAAGGSTIVGTMAGHNFETEMGVVDDGSDLGEVGPVRAQGRERKRRWGKNQGFEEPVVGYTSRVAETGPVQPRQSESPVAVAGGPGETTAVRALEERLLAAPHQGY
jgi:hypothetical protein